MAIQRLTCPSCGAPLDPAPGQDMVTCSFCSTPLRVAGLRSEPPAPRSAQSAPARPLVSPLANASLAFGVAAWLLAPFVGAAIAVLAGHKAQRDIASSGGRLTGETRALIGLLLGYAQLGLVALAVIGSLVQRLGG